MSRLDYERYASALESSALEYIPIYRAYRSRRNPRIAVFEVDRAYMPKYYGFAVLGMTDGATFIIIDKNLPWHLKDEILDHEEMHCAYPFDDELTIRAKTRAARLASGKRCYLH